MSQSNTDYNTLADLLLDIRQTERRYRNIKRQIILMSNNIRQVICRHRRAVRGDRRRFWEPLRMRLMMFERARNMFMRYGYNMAKKLDDMEQTLKDEYDIEIGRAHV